MTKTVKVSYRTFGLPEPEPGTQPPHGGEWWLFSGMGTGLDGTIYCGLCDHRFRYTGALLISYCPAAGEMRTLADMQEICGQRHRHDLMGHTKIHTRVIPDSDGCMYLGTHSCERDYAPPEFRERLTGGYPGGHWIRYDPARGVCEDLGIAAPGESLMGFALDPRTHRLYATTHTRALLVEHDIQAGRSEVVGCIGKYPTRVLERTADGMLYTFDDWGYVVRFDPESRELRTLEARLPGGEGRANLVSCFAAVVGLDGYTIYGVSAAFHFQPREPVGEVVEGRTSETLPGYAFAYDTRAGPDGRMRTIGPAQPESEVEAGDLHLHHSIALTRSGDVLYVSARKDRPAHLMMIDVSGGSSRAGAAGRERLVDCGEMWADGDEGYVETALAGTTGLDGTVYFGGPRKSDKYPRDYLRWVLIMLPPESWR